jgi:hypothetical protein
MRADNQVGWEDTDTLAQKLVPGKDPTNRLTVWIKTIAEGGAQAHTFAQFTVNGKTSMWGTNTQNPGHAVSWARSHNGWLSVRITSTGWMSHTICPLTPI